MLVDDAELEFAGDRIAGPGERRAAFSLAVLVPLAALVAAGLRETPSLPLAVFRSATGSALLAVALATAAILRLRYRTSGRAMLGILAVAFGYLALATVPLLCAPAGGSLAVADRLLRDAGFIALLGVARLRVRRPASETAAEHRFVRLVASLTVLLGAIAFGSLALFRDVLPMLVDRGGDLTETARFAGRLVVVVPAAVLLAEIVRQTRLRRSHDLWIALVVVVAIGEAILANGVASGPSTFAWYASSALAALGPTIFLAVQLGVVFELLRAYAAHNQMLTEIAQRDGLTGLLNRSTFDTRLESLWLQCRRVRAPLSLLVLDIDYFKSYNDHYGHLSGDEALRRIGRALAQATTRPTDLACRIGGEEFALLLPFTDEAGATAVAERVVVRIRALGIPHAPRLSVDRLTVSVGTSTSIGGAVSHQMLFSRADAALYHAKRAGRDRIGRARIREASARAG